MSVIAIIAVIVIALLLSAVITARLGFFKFGSTIFGSIFKKPATLMYPVVPREWQERTRGSISIKGEDCIACGICERGCPTKAISVDKAGGKWTIERMQCIQCGYCADSCPKKCLTMENQYTIPDVVKIVDSYDIPAKAPAEGAKGADGGADTAADGDLTCADSCVFCGLCAKACPADAIKVDRKAKTWEVDTDACVKCGVCISKCPKKSLSFGGNNAAAAAEPAKKQIAAVDEEKCVHCNACANECAAGALEVEVESWNLDADKCIGCGACEDVCPADAISMKEV